VPPQRVVEGFDAAEDGEPRLVASGERPSLDELVLDRRALGAPIVPGIACGPMLAMIFESRSVRLIAIEVYCASLRSRLCLSRHQLAEAVVDQDAVY
jgi:hypothetical protein